jgi:hypothetical protein
MPFHRVDPIGDAADDSRRIARARADLQHSLAGPDAGSLDHQGHDERLRDRLAFADGKRGVVIGAFLQPLVHEPLARHGTKRVQHQRALDAARRRMVEEQIVARGLHPFALHRPVPTGDRG